MHDKILSVTGTVSAEPSTLRISAGTGNGGPMKLSGHFESRGKRFYQVIVLGKEKEVAPEQSEQFMKSFTLL